MTGERNLPGLGLRGYFPPGTGGWGDPRSEDLRLVSAVGNMQAISRTTSLPGSGNLGDIYIVPTADANGDDLAVWDGPAGSEVWNYYTPTGAWLFYIADELTTVQWDGTSWAPFAGGTGGGGGGAVVGPLMHVVDQKADGVPGGTPPLSDAWFARDLTEALHNAIPGASLGVNQIVLPAGDYVMIASTAGHQVGQHQIRLWDTTAAAVVPDMTGDNAFSDGTIDNTGNRAFLSGVFTLAVESTLELQHIVNTATATIGLGVPMGGGLTPIMVEKYTDVLIWQIPSTGIMNSREEQSSGTPGGTSVAGRNVRGFNVDVGNTIVGASRAGAVFTLPPGAYVVEADSVAQSADEHGLRINNLTVGDPNFRIGRNADTTVQDQSSANIYAAFEITVETDIQIEHYITSGQTTTGLGRPIGEAGVVEVYAEIIITKNR